MDLKKALSERFDSLLENKQEFILKAANRLDESEIVPAKSLQNILRPIFGKSGVKEPSIGDHPDFIHLKGRNSKEYCPITTLFMDIEGSTRLGLLFPPEQVQIIKNAFISTAIEIVQSFDGHVHRIMGDAVMAYFGGKNEDPDQAIIDALNASATLNFFVEQKVVPKLTEMVGGEHKFGIRIGLDHGSKESVLWSAYGYPGVEEVTATSFFVDMASKLQHSAPRNQIMIGQSLKEQRDFPNELLDIKTVTVAGDKKTQPFVKPNLTDKNGNAVNYQQFILKWREYLKTTPLSPFMEDSKKLLGASIQTGVYNEQEGLREGLLRPSSVIVDKKKHLRFQVSLPFMPRLPYTVKFKVNNHGVEAENSEEENNGNHETIIEVSRESQHKAITHWEHTGYKGLHYMNISVVSHGNKLLDQTLGVYVR